MDPRNEEDLKLLNVAQDTSYRWLADHRETALELRRMYAGQHYHSGHNSPFRSDMNVVKTAVSTFAFAITPANPALCIRAATNKQTPYAAELEAATNFCVKAIEAQPEIALAILQAFDSLGIIKVGIDRAWSTDPVRRYFSKAILFDNWNHDCAAGKWSEARFFSDIYSVDANELKDSGRYDAELTKRLNPEGRYSSTETGEQRSDDTDADSPTEIIYLRDTYLTREKLVITQPMQDPEIVLKVRKVQDNPYHILCFDPVVGQLMPVPPGTDMMDMGESINTGQWKLRQQLLQAKRWWAVQGGMQSDANQLVQAKDGDVRKVLNPQMAKLMEIPGPDPMIATFVGQLMNWYNWVAGNVSLAAGLAPVASTLGQDQMLSSAASAFQRKMASHSSAFVLDILKAIASLIHHDKKANIKGLYKDIGGGKMAAFDYSPKLRDHDWLEMTFSMTAFSAKDLTPGDHYMAMRQLFQDFILPAMQSGQVPADWSAIIRRAAKDIGVDDIETMLKMVGVSPFAGSHEAKPHSGGQKRYIHESRPAARAQDWTAGIPDMPGKPSEARVA